MTDMITVSRKEIEAIIKTDHGVSEFAYQEIQAILDKAEVSAPVASYYGILDTGTVIDVNDTYDESNNKLQSLIKYDIDYKSATIIPLYTSLPDQSAKIAELEAEIARLKGGNNSNPPTVQAALWTVEDEKRMDIIGQNSNEGLHYDSE